MPVNRQRAKKVGIRQRKAAELRAQGRSLREIAAALKVSHMTASRDLAAWDAAHPSHNGAGNVTADVRLGDFREVLADLAPGSVDAVITDPPYGRKDLPQWSDLAEHAAKWLRPGGILAAMSGQLYLREVRAALDAHLDDWWEMCYLMPGNAPYVWPRRVSPQWKPVLVYRNGDGPLPPAIGDDVAGSRPGRGEKQLQPLGPVRIRHGTHSKRGSPGPVTSSWTRSAGRARLAWWRSRRAAGSLALRSTPSTARRPGGGWRPASELPCGLPRAVQMFNLWP